LKRIAGQSSLILPNSIEEDGKTGLLFLIASAKEHYRELQDRSSFLLCFCQRALKRITVQDKSLLLLCFCQRALKRITGQSASFLPNSNEEDCRTGLLCFCQKASKRIA
jgi:hypothetical protein